MKSQELIALLQRERQQERSTTRNQIAYRYQAEDVLEDTQFYKVETVSVPDAGQTTVGIGSLRLDIGAFPYLHQARVVQRLTQQYPSRDLLAITLLGKEDPTIQDSEGAEQDWRIYVDSYVLVSPLNRQLCTPRMSKQTGSRAASS